MSNLVDDGDAGASFDGDAAWILIMDIRTKRYMHQREQLTPMASHGVERQFRILTRWVTQSLSRAFKNSIPASTGPPTASLNNHIFWGSLKQLLTLADCK